VVWLDSPRHGLSRLAARGRLSSFSVLLLALLAEHRLGPLGPAPAVRPGRPSAAAPTPPAASMPTAASPLSRASPPSAGSPPSTPSTQPAVPDTEATETVARAEPVAADPEPGALSAPAPASAPVAVSDGRPRPPRQPRRAHPPPRGQPAPRLSRSGLRNGLLDQLGVSVQVAGSLRNAGLLAPEVGVALRWRSAVVEAGYQAPVRWSLEGREIEVQTVLVGAGWAPRLWQRGRVRVNGKLGMVGERVVLQRQDLERTAARDHAFWDLGAVLGTSLQVRLAGGLSAGLALEGVWFPAGHEIRIPLGPSARLNQLALRLGLRVAWGGRGDPAGQVL
jgi:hypothetical protein